jgi:hypothetical protein
MTRDEAGRLFKYDAWDRLTAQHDGGSARDYVRYTYDTRATTSSGSRTASASSITTKSAGSSSADRRSYRLPPPPRATYPLFR